MANHGRLSVYCTLGMAGFTMYTLFPCRFMNDNTVPTEASEILRVHCQLDSDPLDLCKDADPMMTPFKHIVTGVKEFLWAARDHKAKGMQQNGHTAQVAAEVQVRQHPHAQLASQQVATSPCVTLFQICSLMSAMWTRVRCLGPHGRSVVLFSTLLHC